MPENSGARQQSWREEGMQRVRRDPSMLDLGWNLGFKGRVRLCWVRDFKPWL
jgi:hypothetical protein